VQKDVVRDRETGMKLADRNRELIPETRRSISKGTISNKNGVDGRTGLTRDEEQLLRGG